MVNAKQELLEHSKDRHIDFINLVYNDTIIKGPLDAVIDSLDFVYDDGFGTQELFGYVWYTDGTWSERQEYGGSEWWVHKTVPDRNADVRT